MKNIFGGKAMWVPGLLLAAGIVTVLFSSAAGPSVVRHTLLYI